MAAALWYEASTLLSTSVGQLNVFSISQSHTIEKNRITGIFNVRSRVSNPVFTETEKPGNPEFFQNRKTGFWLPVNPVFRF